MGKVKQEQRKEINLILIGMFSSIGMDNPSNLDEITDFVFNDIIDSADEYWSSADVTIGYRRWIESKADEVRTIPNVPEPERFKLNEGVEFRTDILHELQVLIKKYMPVKNVQKAEQLTPIDGDIMPQAPMVSIGQRIDSLGELRFLINDLDNVDRIVLETCDEDGDVEDLYPMYVDVFEDCTGGDDNKIREIRFCQIRPEENKDKRDKQPVIDAVIKQSTVLPELLKLIPYNVLLYSLPEDQWKDFNEHDEILTPVVSRGEMIETIMNGRFNDDNPKNDGSNLLYLESLSDDELESMCNNIN